LRGLSFAVLVMMPIAVATAYYFAVAADQYLAEFRFYAQHRRPAASRPVVALHGHRDPFAGGVGIADPRPMIMDPPRPRSMTIAACLRRLVGRGGGRAHQCTPWRPASKLIAGVV